MTVVKYSQGTCLMVKSAYEGPWKSCVYQNAEISTKVLVQTCLLRLCARPSHLIFTQNDAWQKLHWLCVSLYCSQFQSDTKLKCFCVITLSAKTAAFQMFIFHYHALYVKVILHGKPICIELVFSRHLSYGYLEFWTLSTMGAGEWKRGWVMEHLHPSALSFSILWENPAFLCSPLIICVTNKCSKWIGQKSNVCLGNDSIPNVFYAVIHLEITGFMDKAGGWIWHWCKNAGIHSLLYCCSDRNTFLT